MFFFTYLNKLKITLRHFENTMLPFVADVTFCITVLYCLFLFAFFNFSLNVYFLHRFTIHCNNKVLKAGGGIKKKRESLLALFIHTVYMIYIRYIAYI